MGREVSAFRRASTGRLAGVLRYGIGPLVSRDIIGEKASRVFGSKLTEASGTLVKDFGWYDNETTIPRDHARDKIVSLVTMETGASAGKMT
jgi:glyceraldehyde-3-phosphate dehydrogenase/erythrose-4-phosphate dehydrogenase